MGLIYLVRHGQTAWNRDGKFRGLADMPLNEQGRAEAAGAAEALRDVHLDYIYSSPLGRAVETAQAIAERRDLEIRFEPAFTSIDYGLWTGRPVKELREQFPDVYAVWRKSPERIRFPEGESLDDVRQRAGKRFYELVEQHREDSIAITSHRLLLKVLVLAAKRLDNSHFWDIRLDTGAFCILESNETGVQVVRLNETGHLPSLNGHDKMDS